MDKWGCVKYENVYRKKQHYKVKTSHIVGGDIWHAKIEKETASKRHKTNQFLKGNQPKRKTGKDYKQAIDPRN